MWKASEFVRIFRLLRRGGIIHPYISIAYKNSFTKKGIIISTDDGRPIRPLVVVQNKTIEYPSSITTIAKLCTGRDDLTDDEFFSIDRIVDIEAFMKWKSEPSTLSAGIIEYIDPQE